MASAKGAIKGEELNKVHKAASNADVLNSRKAALRRFSNRPRSHNPAAGIRVTQGVAGRGKR